MNVIFSDLPVMYRINPDGYVAKLRDMADNLPDREREIIIECADIIEWLNKCKQKGGNK